MTVPTWQKSSYSGEESNCVEVRRSTEVTDVRDTKHRAGGELTVATPTWHTFLDTLR